MEVYLGTKRLTDVKNTNKKRILTKVPINCKRYDKYDVNRLIQTQIGIAY